MAAERDHVCELPVPLGLELGRGKPEAAKAPGERVLGDFEQSGPRAVVLQTDEFLDEEAGPLDRVRDPPLLRDQRAGQ